MKLNGVRSLTILNTAYQTPMGSVTRADNTRSPSLGHFRIPYVNDSGRKFSSYLEINNLLAITTCFGKRRYATWIHPRSKLGHQIDHFIVKKNKSNLFIDAGVTQSVVDSYHQAEIFVSFV